MLQAREVVRLKLCGFANALAPVICLAALVLHGNHGAEIRRQRPESIEEVAHGPDRWPAYGLEPSPQFPLRAEHQGGCVHAAHVCPRYRWWLRFPADRRTFGAAPRLSRSYVLTVPPCYDASFQILARGSTCLWRFGCLSFLGKYFFRNPRLRHLRVEQFRPLIRVFLIAGRA